MVKPEINVEKEFGPIVCLSYSPNNQNLVVGTAAGKLWLLKSNVVQESFQREQTSFPSPVTACAVSNDGTVVGGFTDGSVWVFEPGPSPKSVRLSPRAIYQFAAPVKAVSLQEGQNKHPQHVAALWEWQPTGCTRPGLPGQSIQIWDLQRTWDLKPAYQPLLVSTRCFPNQRITTIGLVRLIKSGDKITDIQLPVVFGKEVQLIPCRGCARGNETATQMLDRLKDEVKQLGVRNIDDDTLATSYGIRF